MNNEIAKRYRLCSNCSDRILSGGCDGKCKEYWKYVGAKEQQAIDEEVRLKKSDAMTEAEYDRETAFADWYLKNGKSTPTYSDAIEWARKQTIDEAYKWVDKCLHFFVMKNHINYTALEQEFRKAMEEEL